jgi:hypothetical protein
MEEELASLCEDLMRLLSAKMIELDKSTRTDRSLREEHEEYVVD